MKELVIFGCGGFGREVADVVDAINAVNPIWQIVGFADDGPSPQDLERLHRTGRRHLSDEDLAGLGPSVNYVIAVGDGQVRRRLSARLDGMGWSAAVLVHPSATIGAEVTLGPGTVICAGVRITTRDGQVEASAASLAREAARAVTAAACFMVRTRLR